MYKKQSSIRIVRVLNANLYISILCIILSMIQSRIQETLGSVIILKMVKNPFQVMLNICVNFRDTWRSTLNSPTNQSNLGPGLSR